MSQPTRQSEEVRNYEFGPFRVDAANRLLLRAGEVVPLTSKVFDILLVFVQNSGRLLDKDEVMHAVWPDSFVEEGNLTRNVSTLRKALGESPHEHQYIVTVPGRGYRFVARVREVENNDDALVAEERIRVRIVAEEAVEIARPIIRLMALPFRMLRADPDVDFLAFSVPDAVAGALSVLDSVAVLSPTGAARYADELLDLKRIAEEAQADVVLTGTILRAGNGIRVTCQLVEVSDGTVLWWHEPHVSMSDLFELQDDLVRRIVASLSPSLSAREHGRLKRDVPTAAVAYEFYLRGNELSRRGLAGFNDLAVARDFYLRSVEADPRYAPAWAQLGRCYRLIGKGVENGRENFALAESAFQRALELNADLPLAHSQYAFLEAELGRATDAVARLLRCAQTGSASPDLFVSLVLCCRFCGLLEASVAAHERARQLDPLIATSVSHTYYQLGDYDSALRNVAVGSWGIAGMTLGTMGRTADGLAAFRNLEQSGMPVPMRAFIGAWRAMLEGNRQASLDAAEQCIQHYLDPEGEFYMGLIMAHLGESERALTVLSECMDRGFASVHILQRNPWFDGLRRAAQFTDLIKRAEARFVAADEVYRSTGGPQMLGGGLGVEERIRARIVAEEEIEDGDESAPPDLLDSASLGRSDEPAARATSLTLAAQTATIEAAPSITRTSQLTGRLAQHRRPVALGAAVLVLLTAAVAYFYFARSSKVAAEQTRIDSLAIMPFVNTSADPEMEYLSDGITESLINRLSLFPNLKVMSRNSVFHYKGRELDARAIGRELGVRAALTGRIVQRGDALSISVELVDARDNSHLWGEQYERKLADVLSVQREITQEIAAKLRLPLTGAEQALGNKRYTENAAAYQLYLKGRFFWNKRTGAALQTAASYFKQAVAADPAYAPAYAGLAGCYALYSTYEVSSPKDAFPKAKEAALKALALDETLAEAHTSLAFVLYHYDWDWTRAEREFKRAIELNPNDSAAHHWYGEYLGAVGRFDEAVAEYRVALQLDPLSLIINNDFGYDFYLARRFDEAVAQYRKALELESKASIVHYELSATYAQQGKYAEAAAEYFTALQADGFSPQQIAPLKEAFAASGYAGLIRSKLAWRSVYAQKYRIRPQTLAVDYAFLHDTDEACAWLQKAYEERDADLVFLKVNPVFDNLHDEPRFTDLLRRIGLQ